MSLHALMDDQWIKLGDDVVIEADDTTPTGAAGQAAGEWVSGSGWGVAATVLFPGLARLDKLYVTGAGEAVDAADEEARQLARDRLVLVLGGAAVAPDGIVKPVMEELPKVAGESSSSATILFAALDEASMTAFKEARQRVVDERAGADADRRRQVLTAASARGGLFPVKGEVTLGEGLAPVLYSVSNRPHGSAERKLMDVMVEDGVLEVSSRPNPRGGRPTKYWTITPAGVRELRGDPELGDNAAVAAAASEAAAARTREGVARRAAAEAAADQRLPRCVLYAEAARDEAARRALEPYAGVEPSAPQYAGVAPAAGKTSGGGQAP